MSKMPKNIILRAFCQEKGKTLHSLKSYGTKLSISHTFELLYLLTIPQDTIV